MQSTISSFQRFFFQIRIFRPKIRICALSRVFRFFHTIIYGVWNMLHHKTFMLQFLWCLAPKQAILTGLLGTMKLNTNNRFDLETWNLQGQGHRQRSQWVELIKVYLHLKFERGIVNGHSANNLNAITDLTLKLGTFKVKVTDKGHNG